MRAAARALAPALMLCAALAPATAADAPFWFVDTAAAAGLDAPTWCGSRAKPHILESGGSGLALVDYDGDGDLDLYLVNAWRLEDGRVAERGRNRLYRNRGDGTFDDVTEHAGVGDDGWGNGVAVGDANGDGELDIFVTNFGPDVLYTNRGDGTFARSDSASGGPGLAGWSTGAVFFDPDGDGDEDLFVAAYIDTTMAEVLAAKPTLEWQGQAVMKGPFGYEGAENRFFENLGGGRFRDATAAFGLVDVGKYYSFGVEALDLDGDRDLDLYVANDSNPNYLYLNDGKGRFQEVGLWSGAALDAGGNAQGSMGVAAGDTDGDGDPELVTTNFWADASTLYRNEGEALFTDVARATGVAEPSFMPLEWGTTLSDLDVDGDLDLVIVNGHIYPQADAVPAAGPGYKQRNLLLANERGQFTDVTGAAGPGFAVVESSRGLAVGDVDEDGDLDLAVSNVDAAPTLLRNDTAPSGRHWLLIEAPGAIRVEARAGNARWVRHRIIGGSYLSVSDPHFHFGLGAVERVDALVVDYAGGASASWRNVEVDRVLRLPARNGGTAGTASASP